ncbi:XRE family transcriptional regulator [Brevibacillus formosus]|uniref:helix-turn-helix domain-containing protein n=1 Tax=Brevibacillus formosus TaxID=54913 RepID=UPI001CA47C76|nr:helix-turn-helix transcriptional regulator [Brevibacillus formosus]MBW5471554.1 XRE family transcriptional regulator [Brevibacillus formosus]
MTTNKLGKERSPVGLWLDDHGVSQQFVGEKAGLSKNTMSNLCKKNGTPPTGTTISKVMDVLIEIDPRVRKEKLWPFLNGRQNPKSKQD